VQLYRGRGRLPAQSGEQSADLVAGWRVQLVIVPVAAAGLGRDLFQ
jgi:hypothetical protein